MSHLGSIHRNNRNSSWGRTVYNSPSAVTPRSCSVNAPPGSNSPFNLSNTAAEHRFTLSRHNHPPARRDLTSTLSTHSKPPDPILPEWEREVIREEREEREARREEVEAGERGEREERREERRVILSMNTCGKEERWDLYYLIKIKNKWIFFLITYIKWKFESMASSLPLPKQFFKHYKSFPCRFYHRKMKPWFWCKTKNCRRA